MPDYSKGSTFNKDANFQAVRFGADAPLLETELNELQDIQNEARADIVRDSIPSGFTKLSAIDYTTMATTPNTIKLSEESVAYVNGYKINIPKDTVITLNTPPEQTPREDLVFLEVWKEEIDKTETITTGGKDGATAITNYLQDARIGAETARRVQLKWRLRVVDNVDFSKLAIEDDGIQPYDDLSGYLKVTPQGANSSPLTVTYNNRVVQSFLKSASRLSYGRPYPTDIGLFIAGSGDDTCKSLYKTIDGYVYAIPMFRVYRRPSCGYMESNEYNIISPLISPSLTKRITDGERVTHEKDKMSVTVEGKSLVNLLGEGGNCEDLSKWTLGSTVPTKDTSIKLISTSSFKCSASNNQSTFQKELVLDMTHKYFVSTYCYISSFTSGAFKISCSDYGSWNNQSLATADNTKLNAWQRLSQVVTGKSGGGMRLQLGISATGTLTAYADGVMVYDLTAIYGAGNEPTDIALLERALPYVDSIQASKPVAIKGTGKNLLDKDSPWGEIVSVTTQRTNTGVRLTSTSSGSYRRADIQVNLKPNTQYTLSRTLNIISGATQSASASIKVFTNPLVGSELGVISKIDSSSTFTTPNTGKVIVRFYATNSISDSADVEFNDLMLVEGATASAYEPYKASQVILPSNITDSLKELPNGVKDTIDLVNMKLTKRVGSVVLRGDEGWILETGNSVNQINTLSFTLNSVNNYQSSVSSTNIIGVSSDLFTPCSATYLYATDVEGISIDTTNIRVRVLKSKLTTQDLSGFKLWLSSNQVSTYLNLTTPIEYNIADLIKGRLYINPENTTFQVEQVSSKQVNPIPISPTRKDDFEVITGWTCGGTYNTSAISSVDKVTGSNSLNIIGLGVGDSSTNRIICDSANLSLVNGNKYYISCRARSNSGNNAEFKVLIGFIGTIPFTLSTTWSNYSFLGSSSSTSNSAITLYSTDNTCNIYMDSFQVVNLTEIFGSGNEPSKEWCDTYLEFGTNYAFLSPQNTTPLAVVRDNKDTFNGVYKNVGVVPASKYRSGLYEIYYNDLSETHVPPVVKIGVGSQLLEIKDGATVGSLTLTSTDVPYKKNSDGSITYIKPSFSSRVGTCYAVGDTSTWTFANQSDYDACNIGDVFKYSTTNKFQVISKNGSNAVTMKLLGYTPLPVTFGAGTDVYYRASKRSDELYSNIVNQKDMAEDLRHSVSLTGFNYSQLLEESFDKLLRGEL